MNDDYKMRKATPEDEAEIGKAMHAEVPRMPQWFPVGMSGSAWHMKLNGGKKMRRDVVFDREYKYAFHEGMLLRTERGVWLVCMLGEVLIGQKREDGSVETTPPAFGVSRGDHEVIYEAADPAWPEGCGRAEDGSVVCVCEL